MAVAKMMAGVPTLNAGLYRKIGFLVGDPIVWIELDSDKGLAKHLILRDIELDRARKHSKATQCWSPADFAPAEGLSGDRETATAQAGAEFLRRHKLTEVTVDRSIPMIYVDQLRKTGIDVACDLEWGIVERRQKSSDEIEHIRFAQSQTEIVMERACRTIANAVASADGTLHWEGAPLTSERMLARIDVWLLELGFTNPTSIVAGGPVGADCHDHGHGVLKTGEPVIIDIFPRSKATLYNGDCTRTVVHGEIPDQVVAMHAAVVRAKHAATAAVKAGATGQSIHEATIASITGDGYSMGLPATDTPPNYTAMTHGTGHGLGLEVHEPPLLAAGGPALLVGDVVTIEPGLYCKAVGGVRVEDMVVVTESGCINLNSLHEGLVWK